VGRPVVGVLHRSVVAGMPSAIGDRLSARKAAQWVF
jgi:hypothetical protein